MMSKSCVLSMTKNVADISDYPHYARLAEELEFVTQIEFLFNAEFRDKLSAGSFAQFIELMMS